jgi:asparagine synthase (glutamine-hydrolysing)
MCGICGVMWPDPAPGGDGAELVTAGVLKRMADTIAHRGPDDEGVFVDPCRRMGLGFRRLSIIDLTAAGHQPMTNEDGTIWLVLNGEIYNFRELRHELAARHDFKSRTDTEVIIHGYEEWGVDVLQRLRGMFAFALWNGRTQELLLARDRVGIKPLFYYRGPRHLVFGSELKAVLAAPAVPRRVNVRALYDYLTYNYVPCPNTAYEDIYKLPPAHYMVASRTDVRVQRYWAVDPADVAPCDERTAAERVRALLDDAVRSHLVADVPVGVFLSGGLDSSTVASLMAAAEPDPIQTFSVGFDPPDRSELPFARAVADHVGTRHFERVVGWTDARTELERVVSVYDEPFADSSSVPTLAVSALAREHVKVALSGEGGDEVFAGYTWYADWLRMEQLAAVAPPGVASLARRTAVWWPFARGWRALNMLAEVECDGLERYARLMEWISVDEKRRLVTPAVQQTLGHYDDRWYLRQFWSEKANPVSRVQYVDLNTYLPDDLLMKVDRASMAVSLEVRVPLLDAALITEAFRLPPELRLKGGVGKRVARNAMMKDLPRVTLERPKQGFNAPVGQWLNGAPEAWARSIVDDGAAVQSGFLRRHAIDQLSPRPDGMRQSKLWVLLMLELWLRRETGMPLPAVH